jgi:ABC-2 type transport system permease protein
VLLVWVLALSWVAVCFGLLARTVEGANGFTFRVLFLPYLSSAFVPTDTMRAGLRAVADVQPVTPITETLRGLLLGTPIGPYGWQAAAWCAGLLVLAYGGATVLFRRRTAA